MGVFRLYREQVIPAGLAETWDFISSPRNLSKITPEYMRFEVTSQKLPEKMYPGMIITYRVSPLPLLRMTWVTEITHVQENRMFVDEQRLGPYSMWHHQHRIREVHGGVMMEDEVHYIPPMGFLGDIANALFIEKQLKTIFDFREQKVTEIFGKVH